MGLKLNINTTTIIKNLKIGNEDFEVVDSFAINSKKKKKQDS